MDNKPVTSLYDRYRKKMEDLAKDSEADNLLKALKSGKNTYCRVDKLEKSGFDSSWIEQIEGVIFDLGDIIQNPRQSTKSEASLVPVELARKTNAESVQHLASHTQYIKDVDENGDVTPSKILNIAYEDLLATYENRFIATFVRRLLLFVQKRYEFVINFSPLHDEEILLYKNQTTYGKSEIEIESKIKVKTENTSTVGLESNEYVQRIAQIRTYILYFYNSDFMKKLKTERDVRSPILQTNIIRKNPKYHHCYEVFRFIEKYESLGVTYKLDENYMLLNDKELDEINFAILSNYLTLRAKRPDHSVKSYSKTYKPKILTTLEDESFVYGPYLKGPVEFVRVDEQYRQYLESKQHLDLPSRPNKAEREYYKNEYAENKTLKKDEIELNRLAKRRERENLKFDKKAANIANYRMIEEERIEKMLLEDIQVQQKERLDEIRQRIIKEALDDSRLKRKQYKMAISNPNLTSDALFAPENVPLALVLDPNNRTEVNTVEGTSLDELLVNGLSVESDTDLNIAQVIESHEEEITDEDLGIEKEVGVLPKQSRKLNFKDILTKDIDNEMLRRDVLIRKINTKKFVIKDKNNG